jgi:hypothetical protein
MKEDKKGTKVLEMNQKTTNKVLRVRFYLSKIATNVKNKIQVTRPIHSLTSG